MAKPPLKFLALLVPVVGIVLVLVLFRDRGQPPAPETPEKPARGGAAVEGPKRIAAGDQLPGEDVRALGNSETRAATARRLGETKDTRASSYLRAYCSDSDAEVRLATIWALGEIGDRQAALEISNRTGDTDPRVQLEVAVALAKLISAEDPSEAAVSGLTEGLKNEDVKVKLAAARGLAKCRDDKGIEQLVVLLGHKDPAVRKGAEDGLRGVGEAMVPALTKKLAQPKADEDTLRNVRLLGIFKRKESVPTLLHVIEAVCVEPRGRGPAQVKSPVRDACVEALIAIGPDVISELDEQAVKERCPLAVKEAAADVLKHFGSASVAPICQRVLVRQIFPEELELKLWIDTLGEIGDPAAAPALSSALTKPVKDLDFYKKAVADAVKKIEAKTGKPLTLPPPPPKD